MTVEVKPVASRRDLTRFIKLPMRLYRNEPNWIPRSSRSGGRSSTAARTRSSSHAEAEFFLAWRDGEPVGRISAHVDHHFNEFQGNDWGLFGFFEAENDPEVAGALLDTAEEWLRDRGRDRMVGPMDFTTNDECGLLVEGHERPPLILEGWHHPYYLELLEGWGLARRWTSTCGSCASTRSRTRAASTR